MDRACQYLSRHLLRGACYTRARPQCELCDRLGPKVRYLKVQVKPGYGALSSSPHSSECRADGLRIVCCVMRDKGDFLID